MPATPPVRNATCSAFGIELRTLCDLGDRQTAGTAGNRMKNTGAVRLHDGAGLDDLGLRIEQGDGHDVEPLEQQEEEVHSFFRIEV